MDALLLFGNVAVGNREARAIEDDEKGSQLSHLWENHPTGAFSVWACTGICTKGFMCI